MSICVHMFSKCSGSGIVYEIWTGPMLGLADISALYLCGQPHIITSVSVLKNANGEKRIGEDQGPLSHVREDLWAISECGGRL